MTTRGSNAVVGAHDAKTHLAQLLDRVERGEQVVITRHGRPIARLVPTGSEHDVARARSAATALLAMRQRLAAKGVAPFSDKEIRTLRDEGRT